MFFIYREAVSSNERAETELKSVTANESAYYTLFVLNSLYLVSCILHLLSCYGAVYTHITFVLLDGCVISFTWLGRLQLQSLPFLVTLDSTFTSIFAGRVSAQFALRAACPGVIREG